MRNKLTIAVILLAVISGAAWSVLLHARSAAVTHAPGHLEQLDARWAWAVDPATGIKGKKGFYIGYSIRRMMGEHPHISSSSNPGNRDVPTLNEIIYGKKPASSRSGPGGASIAGAAKAALNRLKSRDKTGKKVLKIAALLFRFDAGAKAPAPPQGCREITINNLDVPMDLEDIPVFWLGRVESSESIAFLENFYHTVKKTASLDVREDILTAVGIHGRNPRAFGFLKAVLIGNEPDETRENAAFWLGQQGSPEAAKLLFRTASADRSADVREKAVFGIYLIDLKEADDALIDLAKGGKYRDVRKKAVFWLGQKAVKRCEEVLTGVVNEDKDTKVREAAVFALSQLKDGRGIPALIRIANTHESLRTRKKAIFWLGQSDDPRALDTIIEIIRK